MNYLLKTIFCLLIVLYPVESSFSSEEVNKEGKSKLNSQFLILQRESLTSEQANQLIDEICLSTIDSIKTLKTDDEKMQDPKFQRVLNLYEALLKDIIKAKEMNQPLESQLNIIFALNNHLP